MLKLVAVLAVAAAVALPAARALSSKPTAVSVARAVVARMNSGPDGKLTRRAFCVRGRRIFACELASTRSTRIGARVAVVGGQLRFTWQPLNG